MQEHLALSSCAQKISRQTEIPSALSATPAGASSPEDREEEAASFGRWLWDLPAEQWALTRGAARLLDVAASHHHSTDFCFARVVAEDAPKLRQALAQLRETGQTIDCEFRILHAAEGMRWMRLVSHPTSPRDTAHLTGIVVDLTAARLAEMRERFCFDSAQLLMGAQTLGEAAAKVIQQVCDNLGWECGAYWAPAREQMEHLRLSCKHQWHEGHDRLAPFIQESLSLSVSPGEDLIGHVWSTMQPRWVEELVNESDFRRGRVAHDGGLRSGYAFPVFSVAADGRHQRHGVLEFYSRLSRQREAQLPGLASAIGALIARTADRLEQQHLIQRLAQSDDLTGLANRKHFQQMLDTACSDAGAAGSSIAVLFIDLDRFKPINDAFGHEAGNLVLREFGQRLQALVPPGCAVGRLGGDEFAILLTPLESTPLLHALGTRVLLAASTPFPFGEQELSVTASIGISVFPECGWTGAELMRAADSAMYRSKQAGRNGMHCSSCDTLEAKQQTVLAAQLTMEAELRRALLDNEFFLEYQPIFDGESNAMVAVEALIRWRRRSGELVRPDIFIPVAEQSRLIVQIGRWVVRQACRDVALLHRSGFPDLVVNVNLAAPEFIDAALPDELLAEVEASGVEPRHLCLELTESMVMKQPEKVIPVMSALRQRGFKISLDDFGTGHSSLARLKNLPISSLKIDRSFVSGLPHARDDGAIVRAILDLGHRMNLRVIAEGVETDAQLLFLRQFGCRLIQGYVLSRPKPMAELIALHRGNTQPSPEIPKSAHT